MISTMTSQFVVAVVGDDIGYLLDDTSTVSLMMPHSCCSYLLVVSVVALVVVMI